MIYLDNSATTYPKPEIVSRSVFESFKHFCSNPGRSGHDMAIKTAKRVFECRSTLSKLFKLNDESKVVFTSSCTQALNTVIKGVLKPNDHCIISSFEHNSVLRPLEKLKKKNISYSVATVDINNDDVTVDNFRKQINERTKLIVCTHASNVFGFKLPVKRLCALAHSYDLMFCLDAAQSAGVIDVNLEEDSFDYICCAGHKGLYGPMGIGVMIINNDYLPDSLFEGGSGSDSLSPTQPQYTPDKFESGTLNIPGIIGLEKGASFVLQKGVDNIFSHEMRLINKLDYLLRKNNKIHLYNNKYKELNSLPVLSFSVSNIDSETVAKVLNDKYGIAVRAGLHCAPLAHKSMKTEKNGTIRVSPSVFTTEKEIYILSKALNIF